jgi:hypothetical protein
VRSKDFVQPRSGDSVPKEHRRGRDEVQRKFGAELCEGLVGPRLVSTRCSKVPAPAHTTCHLMIAAAVVSRAHVPPAQAREATSVALRLVICPRFSPSLHLYKLEPLLATLSQPCRSSSRSPGVLETLADDFSRSTTKADPRYPLAGLPLLSSSAPATSALLCPSVW